jgi:UDP-N-acetylmuramoyl-tripeptide--D-alanyl-D-alanine ligase
VTAGLAWTDTTVRQALGIPSEGLGSDGADRDLTFSRVCTDTRAVRDGDLFVALRGDRHDGHDFLREAAAKGARAAVVSRSLEVDEAMELYRVPDTLEGLGRLARSWRRAIPGQVIGITGSSGKTAVKELLTAALRGSFVVHQTQGNLNNRVGLPLSLLAAPANAEFVVLEMGTSEPGEIATLTAIAEPDHAIVTTVSEAHLTGLGSLEGVLSEKLDLLRGSSTDGEAVVGDEPDILPLAARELRPAAHIGGFSERADPACRGVGLRQERGGRYRFQLWDRDVEAGMPGVHGARNLLLALVCAQLVGADEASAIQGASAVTPGPLRGEERAIGGLTIILDCYNANPQSVVAALKLLAGLPGDGRRVAVLGSMLELGDRSMALHRVTLQRALSLSLDLVIATGDFAAAGHELAGPHQPELVLASSIEEGYRALQTRLAGSETVLLKGSRGVAMESLVERFERDYGSSASEIEGPPAAIPSRTNGEV